MICMKVIVSLLFVVFQIILSFHSYILGFTSYFVCVSGRGSRRGGGGGGGGEGIMIKKRIKVKKKKKTRRK